VTPEQIASAKAVLARIDANRAREAKAIADDKMAKRDKDRAAQRPAERRNGKPPPTAEPQNTQIDENRLRRTARPTGSSNAPAANRHRLSHGCEFTSR
jgi:hypothetical protein